MKNAGWIKIYMNLEKCNVCSKMYYAFYKVKVDNINAGFVCRNCLPIWCDNIEIWGWEPEIYYKNKYSRFQKMDIFALKKLKNDILGARCTLQG